MISAPQTRIRNLGKPTHNTLVRAEQYIDDSVIGSVYTQISYLRNSITSGLEVPMFEFAGPRKMLYFNPKKVKAAIVTCGGLCPGLNDVVRAIVLSLHYHYRVADISGIRFGYQGLSESHYLPPMQLNPNIVSRIHYSGGTILGSSRGRPEMDEMVAYLKNHKINMLFTIGGDGTLKGAHAIGEACRKAGWEISVIGVPKTIDNDISFVSKTFGFSTAIGEARKSIETAYNEARGAIHGIGLVKLMGRDSGFIAAHSSLANNDVDFCLIPEQDFEIHHNYGLLHQIKKRIVKRGSVVIVVAEGAGQHLMQGDEVRDASGNLLHADIGLYLKQIIIDYFKEQKVPLNIKYIDPSYTIRSLPANADDSAFCLILGQNAVHAAMAGKTDMIVGSWNDAMVHVPIELAVKERKKIDTKSTFWHHVTFATGQPPLRDPRG